MSGRSPRSRANYPYTTAPFTIFPESRASDMLCSLTRRLGLLYYFCPPVCALHADRSAHSFLHSDFLAQRRRLPSDSTFATIIK
jgi:hypothetical protein